MVFDGQSVKIAGTAGEPRYQESRGKPFTVFDLSDGQGQTMRVFSRGHLTVRLIPSPTLIDRL